MASVVQRIGRKIADLVIQVRFLAEAHKYMVDLSSKITELNRVGQTNYTFLRKLGLETVQDLLFYFPWRYDDFSQNSNIADLEADTKVNIIGTVELIQNKRSARRRMYITEALVSDNSETIKVIWFNQPFLTRTLQIGDKVSLAGKVTENDNQFTMISPVYEKLFSNDPIHTKGLIPIYHSTEKLTQKQLRFLIKQAIPLSSKLEDWLPASIKKRLKLLNLDSALGKIHFPKNQADIISARQRLGFAELFLRQLKAQIIKRELKSRQAHEIMFKEKETKKFVSSLPFALTDSQKKASWEIIKDLGKDSPMSRLLEGDVGSGKTLVAVIALLNTALNKKQGILMVPTEILAQQHFDSLSKLLGGFGLKIGLMTRNNKLKDYKKLDIIIGTHALIQEKVKFHNLALAIIDEQHRFGVEQRKKILDFNDNGQTPHFLSLTATPIPRSLALAIHGDLDISIIDELPLGRKKIMTKIVLEDKRQAAYDFIRQQIAAKHQVFVICPLIEESDKLGAKSVKKEYEKLNKEVFPDLSIGLLHGKMKSIDKDKVMNDFLHNKIQILVSTSVIEVGVDVPNATVMMIEGTERFGLAQLHQFRGRVGRSDHQSYCFLFPSNEELASPKTIERLEAMTKYHDGFSLAKIDLKLRGSGELYGMNQSGFPELQIASLFDYELIKKAQTEASALIEIDPQLNKHPLIQEKLGEWDSQIHLE